MCWVDQGKEKEAVKVVGLKMSGIGIGQADRQAGRESVRSQKLSGMMTGGSVREYDNREKEQEEE